MYSLNKTVLGVLVAAFFASTGVAAWIMQSVLAKVVRQSNYLCLHFWRDLTWIHVLAKAIRLPDGTSFCMPIGILDHFYMFWIPMLIFECLLCGLAIARAVSAFRFGRGGASNWGAARRLIIVLFRDSVAYFLVYVSPAPTSPVPLRRDHSRTAGKQNMCNIPNLFTNMGHRTCTFSWEAIEPQEFLTNSNSAGNPPRSSCDFLRGDVLCSRQPNYPQRPRAQR